MVNPHIRVHVKSESAAKERLKVAQVQNKVWRENQDIGFLKERVDNADNNIQENDSNDFIEEKAEIAEADHDINDELEYQSAFPEMDGILTDSFNTAASGENSVDSDLENELGEDFETEQTYVQTPPTPNGLG